MRAGELGGHHRHLDDIALRHQLDVAASAPKGVELATCAQGFHLAFANTGGGGCARQHHLHPWAIRRRFVMGGGDSGGGFSGSGGSSGGGGASGGW